MKCLTVAVLMLPSLAVAQQVTVQKTVNLRQEPTTASKQLDTLQPGVALTVVGPPKNSFLHVKTSSGVEGWTISRNVGTAVHQRHAFAAHQSAFLLAKPDTTINDRAHSLAPKAASVETNHCEDVSDWETCHKSYAEGCTNATKTGTYDAFLSYLKNLEPDPGSSEQESSKILASIADFQAFDKQSIALDIGKQKQISFADQLADVGQGNIYTAVGYIYYAIVGGIETCNCQLKNPQDRDYHIGLGFDPAMAAKIADGELPIMASKIDSTVQQNSVIVEMTPHFRGQFHENWTLPRVQELEGRQVKVVGQLIMDNEHNTSDQNCAFDNPGPNCWRASVWELHPVTQVYVCTSSAPCRADLPDGWTLLDNLTEH